jgi:hypothetical protein
LLAINPQRAEKELFRQSFNMIFQFFIPLPKLDKIKNQNVAFRDQG